MRNKEVRSVIARFIIILPLVYTPAPVWDLSQWRGVTGGLSCASAANDTLTMRCESAGLVYKPPIDLSRLVAIEMMVRGRSDTGDRFWVGLALNADVAADDRYAELAVTRGIAPADPAWGTGIVLLETSNVYMRWLQPTQPDTWHRFRIEYDAGQVHYIVDGIERARTVVDLGDTAQVELLCVAVNPGESGPGRARCEFKELRIEQ